MDVSPIQLFSIEDSIYIWSSYALLFVGFEVYLVGGCVRDLILKRVPKDFDVITSAELREVSLDCASIYYT